MTDFRAPPIQQPDDPGVVVILRRDVRTGSLCAVRRGVHSRSGGGNAPMIASPALHAGSGDPDGLGNGPASAWTPRHLRHAAHGPIRHRRDRRRNNPTHRAMDDVAAVQSSRARNRRPPWAPRSSSMMRPPWQCRPNSRRRARWWNSYSSPDGLRRHQVFGGVAARTR